MKQARKPTKALWIGAAVISLGAALLTLAGCMMVGDSLNGLKVKRADLTSCVKNCNDLYRNLYGQEQDLHLANVGDCQALPEPDKDACLEAESARHEAAMAALGEAKVECQNDCHRQGTGSAG